MASAAPVAKSEAKIDTAKAAAAAEKAYAEAAAKVEAKPEVAATVVVAPKAEVKPVVAAPAAKAPVAPKAAPAKKAVSKKVSTKKAATKPVAAAKKVAKKITAKKVVKAAAKPAAKPSTPSTLSFKDTIMTKTKTATTDFTAKMQDAVSEAQARAKAVFEKSQTVFADAGEFTKGNVEALVASGKIVAAGLQEAGKDYVAEAKTALETVQADVKELAAVKSPADFFKLQGEILRRNFDASVATASKNSEKVVKLAGEAFAPISTRVSLAVEKVKQAA
jgi:phasin family protein